MLLSSYLNTSGLPGATTIYHLVLAGIADGGDVGIWHTQCRHNIMFFSDENY